MRQFDTKTNEIIEKYVAVMAKHAKCLKTQQPCESICEICQHDHDTWVRNSIMKELGWSIRILELYAPHLLKNNE